MSPNAHANQYTPAQPSNTDLLEKNRQLQAQFDELKRQNETLRAYQATLEQQIENRTKRLDALDHGIISKERKIHQGQKLEALGMLVAGIAHEINNPLNLIHLNISIFNDIWRDLLPILKEHSRNHPERKYGGLPHAYICEKMDTHLAHLDNGIKRIASTVKNLKEFSKQSHVSQKSSVNINNCVENALKLAQTLLKGKNIVVETDLQGDLPLIQANEQSLEQVFLNLMINAIQAIDKQDGKIKITTRMEYRQKIVTFELTDNGQGIDPQFSENIFDPFVTSKQDSGGTGLGLSVSYSLIKAHAGQISFESHPGEGTTFMVTLPTGERQTRILVADDEEPIRKMLIRYAEKNTTYIIDEAKNGIEACLKIGKHPPDLLILDLNMPEMDGLEVCRAIFADSRLSSMRVIIITGYPDDSTLSELEKLGIQHIIKKPLRMDDLFIKIATIMKS